ncbi:unnamed protein product [Cylicocyclus nassatus]|uniref:Uncharacterized protein n=1 Tax=Cylicocyclus nassatus TaxID=53992 RepID=A0AA36M237_CYLNA|nr:unnamed protein product [Cylicocyclus nassatus]
MFTSKSEKDMNCLLVGLLLLSLLDASISINPCGLMDKKSWIVPKPSKIACKKYCKITKDCNDGYCRKNKGRWICECFRCDDNQHGSTFIPGLTHSPFGKSRWKPWKKYQD